MQKASHIIKLPQCPFPNHIFTAVHTRFTRILACACIFRLGLYVDLHGPDLEIIWEVKKSKKNRFFHYYSTNWFEKASYIIYITFFCRKSINFTPIGAQFEACIVSFGCVLHTPCSKKTLFSQNKNATKPVFHSRIS